MGMIGSAGVAAVGRDCGCQMTAKLSISLPGEALMRAPRDAQQQNASDATSETEPNGRVCSGGTQRSPNVLAPSTEFESMKVGAKVTANNDISALCKAGSTVSCSTVEHTASVTTLK